MEGVKLVQSWGALRSAEEPLSTVLVSCRKTRNELRRDRTIDKIDFFYFYFISEPALLYLGLDLLPCLALPCLALPCLALPCLALALPCLALPCLALPWLCLNLVLLALTSLALLPCLAMALLRLLYFFVLRCAALWPYLGLL